MFARFAPLGGCCAHQQREARAPPYAPRPRRGGATAPRGPRRRRWRVAGQRPARWKPLRTARRWVAHEGWQRGAGPTQRRGVRRWSSALPGQALGRGRRPLSVACLLWVALFQRGRLAVVAGACARAVGCRVGLRPAWGRREAAHARHHRMAVARQVGAEVRSCWRATCTAGRVVAHWPRAPSRSV
jgi:hypothetical protein